MGVMGEKTGHPWSKLERADWHMHLRSLVLLAFSLGLNLDDMAKAAGVSWRTLRNWHLRASVPRGYNRRRDVLRDLARFVAEKAGEA